MILVHTTLREQEEIVERGLVSFIEVGRALMRIRDDELYTEDNFEGFVEYLEARPWGLSPSRAYQMIDSASVSTIVETPNEAQARELAPLMRKATPGVVRQVYAEVLEETGGRPTASAIRDKVQQTIHQFAEPNGKEKLQDRPSQYLPDLLDEDSPRNLRTQVVHWCELGRHIESLLNNRADLEPKSEEDLRLILAEVVAMSQIAKRLERSISDG